MSRFDNIDLQINERRMILHHYKTVKETLLELRKELRPNLDTMKDYSSIDRTIEIVEEKIESLKS